MTSRSRRKRLTTAPARSTWRRTAASALGLGLLWAGGAAAQDAPRDLTPPPFARPVAQTPAPPLAGPAPEVERLRPVASTEPAEGPVIQLTVVQQPGMPADRGTQESVT